MRPNEKAIKAYSKSGFNIVRELDCFELFLKDFKPKDPDPNIKIEDVGKDRLNEFVSEIIWIPSWENSFSGIERIENQVISIGAYEENKLVGILIYYPTLNWLMQLIVKKEHRRKGVGTSLLSSLIEKLPSEIESFYCHNIESSQEDAHKFLKANGYKEIIGQYEMELTI